MQSNHRDRKNPKSAEAYQKARAAKNAARPKQHYIFAHKQWVRYYFI